MIAIVVILLVIFLVLTMFGVPMKVASNFIKLIFFAGPLYACNAVT